jgi:Family of unknown function (DUF5706)
VIAGPPTSASRLTTVEPLLLDRCGDGDGGVGVDEAQLARLLNETRDDIARAETKASITLAASSLVIGTVLSELIGRYDSLVVVAKVPLVGSFVAVLLGLVALGMALKPNYVANPAGHEMLAYFGHVAAAGSIEEFERLADAELDERGRLTNQIWTLSYLILRKYQHIRRAFNLLGIAVGLGVLGMALQAIFG